MNMTDYFTDASALLAFALMLYIVVSWGFGQRHTLPLPPGPKGLPILGNFFDMRAAKECETLRTWRDTYGPIVHLRVFGRSYIYLNDYQTMVDLFEKRGNIYSSRPHLVMNDLQGWSEWFVGVLPYGPELRRSRQKLHQFLQKSVIPDYHKLQMQSAYKLAEQLLRQPESYVEIVKCSAADLITRATYGYGITSISDPFISIAERGMEAFADAQGFYLVNELPWLQFLPSWLPGMGFRRVVEDGYKSSMDMYKKPYETFKKKQEIGLGSSSFSAKLLESFKDKNGDVNKADEEFIAKVTSIIYAGGADTTVSTLLTFILAMVLHPDVQRKAQEEFDEVIGNNILPTFEDLQKLTYLDAVRKECLRWQSVVASSAPHTVSRDDEVDGYLIPANSIIMGNIWAILRDPVEYPDPDRFIPERFIPVENKKCPLEPNRVVFSVGRRVCPGKHFAESSIFIDMATIIATCDIGKTLDNYGNPIVPDVEYTKQLIRHPLPFKCLIKPRNKEFFKLLRQNTETEYSAGN